MDGELEKMIQDNPYANDIYHRSESMSENYVRTGYNKAIREVRSMFLAQEVKKCCCESLVGGLNIYCSVCMGRVNVAPEPEAPKFMECDACRAKFGSPYLCAGCLHNRKVIETYTLSQKAGNK